MVDEEILSGGALNGDCNAVSMMRPKDQRPENEHVQCALEKLHGWVF